MAHLANGYGNGGRIPPPSGAIVAGDRGSPTFGREAMPVFKRPDAESIERVSEFLTRHTPAS
jgi:hypothetical protein